MPLKYRFFIIALCLLLRPIADSGSVSGQRKTSNIFRANELGQIMILEYHRISRPESAWSRTPAHFRQDLKKLYTNGFVLYPLNRFIDGIIDVPAGKTPVILTFDDSSDSQFRLRKTKHGTVIDPDCAVGILEEFSRNHPGFGHYATFFVLPKAKQPNNYFSQPRYNRYKTRYLLQRGFEIGNHTLWHANLRQFEHRAVPLIASVQTFINRYAPGYRIRSFVPPFGVFPRDRSVLRRGRYRGTSYHHDAVLRNGGGSCRSIFDHRFRPFFMPRIIVREGTLVRWLRYWRTHPGQRFISDGDPAVITAPAASLRRLSPRWRRRYAIRHPQPK